MSNCTRKTKRKKRSQSSTLIPAKHFTPASRKSARALGGRETGQTKQAFCFRSNVWSRGQYLRELRSSRISQTAKMADVAFGSVRRRKIGLTGNKTLEIKMPKENVCFKQILDVLLEVFMHWMCQRSVGRNTPSFWFNASWIFHRIAGM